MPVWGNTPTRPRRLLSFSSDRLRYSSGPGIGGALFGFLFSSSGLLGLVAWGWGFLSLIGALPPPQGNQLPIGESLLVSLVVLAIGGGHFFIGCLLLWTLRSTLDRARDLVVVRSGWLGWRRDRRRLSEFKAVTVLPASALFANEPWFHIALNDEAGAPLIVGRVTRSYDLARTVVDEISYFTHLPAA
jgi:hypothetical protein